MSIAHDEQSLQRTYSLKRYLATVWLPAFRGVSTPTLGGPGRTRPWPRYEELRGHLGLQGLQKVTRMDLTALNERATDCE